MVNLDEIVNKLNEELGIESFGADPAFKRFIPTTYESINFDWRSAFEKEFLELFNGLMLRGASHVERVYLAVFPTDDVLEQFIAQGNAGDLLFMHHPLLMECGDPQGAAGKGFVPIKEEYIKQMKEKQLSIYTCHIPLDFHPQLGTSVAIANALNAAKTDSFLSYENMGYLGLICSVEDTNTTDLIAKLCDIFDIPYVDFEGQELDHIQKVAIVAGCGDKAEWMLEAEQKGAQAYITGEIHCHINSDYGKEKYSEIMTYAKKTPMSLIGVSHSASEYLVKKTLMKDWFDQHFELTTVLIPQEKWWL